jgi:hypothetical protein
MDRVLVKAFINGFECNLLFVGNAKEVVEYVRSAITPQINFFVVDEKYFNSLCELGIKAYFIPSREMNKIENTDTEKIYDKESTQPDNYNSLKRD